MVFLVLLIPVGVLAFALLMERLEHRLRTESVSEQDVAEFLDHAQRDEVTTFVNEGWTRALSRFRIRSLANQPSRRSRFSRWASSLGASAEPEAAEPRGSVIHDAERATHEAAPKDVPPGADPPNTDMKQ